MMVQHTSRGWENGRGRERGSIDYRVCVKEGEEEREGVECVKEGEREGVECVKEGEEEREGVECVKELERGRE